MSPTRRLAAIERKLKVLPKTPTTANVQFRKVLLRLLDASRLEAGLVSADDLQRENSPFAAADFRSARIIFSRRIADGTVPKKKPRNPTRAKHESG